jgi:hypothetical protein
MDWVNFNKPYKEFVRLNKNIPGALIEVEFNNSRKLFLIGDINTTATIANGGKPFDNTAIVLKYRYVWCHFEPGKQSY